MNDDRLVLEAAAVLSLFSPKKIGMLNHILGGWVEIGGGFEMGSPDGNEKIRLGLTAESIRMTGLKLPSVASCADPAAAIEECASLFILSAAEPEPSLPHIALAFLNLYASISAGQPDWDGLANTGMVWDAWRCVRDFLIGLPNAFRAGTGQSETQTTGCGPCNSAADPWISGLDSMFKILNSADSLQSMPPRPTGEETLEWAAYWAPLPTLTVGLLGWSDPALGVARWILKGMPATTPERALLRKTWGTDALMFFCHPKKDWDPSDGQGLALVHSGLAIADIYELSDRSRDFMRCGELNMSDHLRWTMVGIQRLLPLGETIFCRPNSSVNPSYELQLKSLTGWHSQLRTFGRHLAEKHDGSCLEVTVVAPSALVLGTFRLSEETGRWHSSSNNDHLLGHSQLVEPLDRLRTSGLDAPSAQKDAPRSPGRRHAAALIFWIASELARRHAGYGLYFNDLNGPPQTSALVLRHNEKPTIFLPRSGPIHSENDFILTATEMLAFDSPVELIRVVERGLGLASPAKALPTDRHNIMYRTMAYVLSATVHDRSDWNFAPDTAFPGAPWAPQLSQNEAGEVQWDKGIPWTLLREQEPVAVVTPDGMAYHRRGKVDLLASYLHHSRRLIPVIGDAFGHILP